MKMDPNKILCLSSAQDGTDDPFNPLNQMFVQMAFILVMSHFFFLILKPLGQTGPVAQMLAGLVLSPAVLARNENIKNLLILKSSANYYSFFSFLFRTCFMFLMGLEIDSDFLRRNFRKAAVISGGSFACCSLLGLAFIWLIIRLTKTIGGDYFTFGVCFLIILSNTASPVVFRAIADMKLHTSEIGRLAVSSAMLTEMCSIFVHSLAISMVYPTELKHILYVALLTGILIFLNKYLAPWFSMTRPNEKYLSKTQTLVFFIPIVVVSTITESYNFNSALPTFLIGLAFPREGKSYRTLLQRLSYPVHEFAFPIYFGYLGFRFSFSTFENKKLYFVVVISVILSLGGKVIGVFAACSYQKIPRKHWLFLSSILSMKGHVALLLFDLNSEVKLKWWSLFLHDTFIVVIVTTTLIAGVLASFLLRSQERDFAHEITSIEFHDTDKELRVVSCVYGLHHARGAISLVSALGVSDAPPSHFAPLLMHLVPLPKKHKSIDLLYHEQDDEKFNDFDDYGTNEALEINDEVDSFAKESRILIRQMKVVSKMMSMHEEVCNAAEDLRVAIVFLPFHKHQRIDGKTVNDGDELKTTNQKVLRHAPCSVGIFVHRNQTGFQQPHGYESIQHVAALFFGGPDDREALSLCKWLANNGLLQLTIIRFMPENSKEENQIESASHQNDEFFMEIPQRETENELDRSFLEDFYNRFVTTGQVGYIEKYVDGGLQTLMILKEIGEMYSLFIVGKGRVDSPMTTGMSDWEECPELGTVGDFLASSDHDVNASVLVVQRHKPSHDSLF